MGGYSGFLESLFKLIRSQDFLVVSNLPVDLCSKIPYVMLIKHQHIEYFEGTCDQHIRLKIRHDSFYYQKDRQLDFFNQRIQQIVSDVRIGQSIIMRKRGV